MTDREIFRHWCAQRNDIPIFQTADWLDAVADEDHWDVAVIGQLNDVQAFMPYFHKRKMGFDIITMPPLTPYLGPWIHFPAGQKQASRISFEKKMMDGLIAKLPATDRFIQYFHPAITNWLPFCWQGFRQTTRYTYILPDLSDLDAVYEGIQGNIRREIKKAEAQLEVMRVDDVGPLFDLLKQDYSLKKEKLPISRKYLTGIFNAAQAAQRCAAFVAINKDMGVVASILIVWDGQSAYYLAGAVEAKSKTTGVMSLLLWEAIRHSATVTRAFNFEGSISEPIERFFRAFGGTQTPYFEIGRTNSKLMKLL
ncbi:MAG: GNAT family N-acetyltransferase [Flavobacteriales bacterium]|nr:GNAT family N-acetyltransferase [Flavobacteriales bacterium]